MLNAQLK